ncbi:hypothetical protein BDA99DRAFT_538783 [Phascolomyces articulosus]|uniref:Uncharacterized protein n=1 Tax=Phascolomyces articulosus TaxID=60185 RepID=A0AAD5PCR0_9FUNG|nr:hypothetical protein BDA99DRAFT_538783 [Phascolomyces articulosus]
MAAITTTAQFQTSSFSASYQDPYTQFTSTQLDLTLVHDAFNQRKHTYAAHTYAHAIEFYTKAPNALHQDPHTVILFHRAVAYEKSQQYQKVLNDCQLAFTCKSWYKFVLQEWPYIGSFIDATADHGLPKDPDVLTQFLCIVFRILIQYSWSKIKTLEIHPLSNQQLLDIIQLNKELLKKLNLNHNTNNGGFNHGQGLTDTVRMCHNMHTITFMIEGGADFEYIKPSLTPFNWYPTNLNFSYAMTPDSLIQLLKRIPSLKTLYMVDNNTWSL